MRSIVDIAHHLIQPLFDQNDIMVDATMGNGYDTLFLAKHAKHVYSFDIQQSALDHTKSLLKSHDIHNVSLVLDSHENILSHIHQFKGVLFNLGYLPKGDKSITTTWDVTKKTLEQLMIALPIYGFVAIVVYPGHPAGKIESDGLSSYLQTFDLKTYYILKCELPFVTNNPPYIYLIMKNASQ
jgi:hypothetical protein